MRFALWKVSPGGRRPATFVFPRGPPPNPSRLATTPSMPRRRLSPRCRSKPNDGVSASKTKTEDKEIDKEILPPARPISVQRRVWIARLDLGLGRLLGLWRVSQGDQQGVGGCIAQLTPDRIHDLGFSAQGSELSRRAVLLGSMIRPWSFALAIVAFSAGPAWSTDLANARSSSS